jgi:cytochrome oxidase Cu insertion factor (SCO1/SenC/PrrC family)
MSTAHKILRGLTILMGVAALFVVVLRFNMTRVARTTAASSTPDLGVVPFFSLTERSGRTVTRTELMDKTWVADFIFTRCAGPCPLITTEMSDLSRKFADKPSLRFVSFSVDPTFDTPAVLSKYAASYGADANRWLFLTGSMDAIGALIREGFHLGLEVESTPQGLAKKPTEPPAVTHSVFFVLVAPGGKILGYYNSTLDSDVKTLSEWLSALH